MRRKNIKLLAAVVIGLMISLMACFTAFADWDGTAWWGYDWKGGNVFCKWDKYTNAGGYILEVYKVSDSGSKTTVLGPIDVTGTSKDVTQTIIKKGTGTYVFDILGYTKAKNNETPTADYLTSEDIYIDDAELQKIKLGRANTANSETKTNDGWHQYPNNTWTYGKGNNTLAKNEWLQIDGKWYHFDSKGYMQKGWQQINGNYYYLDATNGYLWVNCQTPDGYTVNADGVRVDSSGTVLTGGALNATVTITLEESGEDGKIKNCTVKSVSNANLISWNFETPYESWIVGTPVRLYVTVSSANNFPFGKNTKISCSQATYKSFTGSNPITIELLYYPNMKLAAPTNISMNDSKVLSWVGSQHATSYSVTIYNNDGTKAGTSDDPNGQFTNPFTCTSTKVDISDKIGDNPDFYVGIIAKHPGGTKTYYKDSNETKCYDLGDKLVSNHLTQGSFSGSGNRVTYTDENGDRAYGWKQIAGSWYCFGTDGYAKGPGWYQDKDSNWYYFNNEYKMVVGKVIDNGKEYLMNDGSNKNFPYGAWIH